MYTTTATSAPYTFSPAPQRKTMSITQTYFLAHKARAKLSSQAARPDHNLRLLVGHANLLDTLMLELADAEREQESWFNQSVRGASQQQQQQQQQQQLQQQQAKAARRVQWADAAIVEEPEEDWQAEYADDDADDDSDASSDMSSDYSESDDEEEDTEPSVEGEDDDDIHMADVAPLRRVASGSKPAVVVEAAAADLTDDDDEYDEDEEALHAHLTLTRSPSHSVAHLSSPPELVNEEDSEASSDDEAAMPPSPPVVALAAPSEADLAAAPGKAAPITTITDAATATTTTIAPVSPHEADEEDEVDAFHDATAQYYLPPRNPARLMSALSVY